MTTARTIIEDALTFGLNKLSPGEALDDDTGAVCLRALNSVADEFNGSGAVLFREVLTSGTVAGQSAAIDVVWQLLPGVRILGATVGATGDEQPLEALTLAQYAEVVDKTISGTPSCYAHDGFNTVYFYPAPVSETVTLRTREYVSDFADLDTDYGMPAGFKAAFSALLAERVAEALTGKVSVAVRNDAKAARSRIAAQVVNPAIIGGGERVPSILTGW